jgi:cobalt-zinc-cadmium efflux system protein
MSGLHHHHHAGPDGHGHAHGHGADGVAAGTEHHHEHRLRRLGERKRLLFALALTGVVFLVEVVGGFWSGSLALLSDAGHMLSDVAAQVLSLVALALSSRPSDARRTYGYYRIEILAALANGVALVVLSGWILWSAVARLHAGAPEVKTGVMLVVAAFGLVANVAGASLLHGAESLNVRGAYLHVLQDLLSSVVVVIGGVVMALVPGLYGLDPVLSIAIGLFVLLGAGRLVRDAVDVLLEAVPSHIDVRAVCEALRGETPVLEVHDLHLWSLTSGVLALSAHVVVAPDALPRSSDLIARMNDRLLRDFRIRHTTIQVESPEFEHVGFTCTHGHEATPENDTRGCKG